MSIDDTDGVMTLSEVAERLKVHVQTVRGWINSGELDSFLIGEHRRRVTRSQLRTFIDKHSASHANH